MARKETVWLEGLARTAQVTEGTITIGVNLEGLFKDSGRRDGLTGQRIFAREGGQR
jgi:hypothetical protein